MAYGKQTRRRYLTIILTMAIAGCLSRNSGPDTVAIGEITVVNYRERSTEVDLSVKRDGEYIHNDTISLDGRDGYQVDGYSIVEPWMGESADFEVNAAVSEVGSESISTDFFVELVDSDDDPNCFPLTIDVRSDTIDIWHGTGGCAEV